MSDTTSLADKAREGRSSGATLKAELATARSRFPDHAILVLEGSDDIGPLSVWISRINDKLVVRFLVGRGKSQLLDLRRRLSRDETGIADSVYLFVDRDFDALRGEPEQANTYVTRGYSIENDLISIESVESILRDELKLAEWDSDFDTCVTLFNSVRQQFGASIESPNLRLFFRVRLGIHGGYIERRISRYVSIEVDSILPRFDDEAIETLIPSIREPTEEERAQLSTEFDSLVPAIHYRGKFWLDWFLQWLDCLARELREGARSKFRSKHNNHFNATTITLRSLAGRCPIPPCFEAFIQNVILPRP